MEMDLSAPVWTPGKSRDQIFKQMLYECLVYYKGNKTRVSKELGMCPRTIRNKVREYKFIEFINIDYSHKMNENEVIDFFKRQDEKNKGMI